MTADSTLDLQHAFGGAKHLCMLHAVMLQEVIATSGKIFKERHGWKLVYGKQEGEFRGEAIAFRMNIATHTQTAVANGRISTVLRMHTGERWGMLSGHIPHHATIPEVDTLLQECQTLPALRTPKAVIGADTNEQFRETTANSAATQSQMGRGDVILNWGAEHGFRLPPPAMDQPSNYPYNAQHDPSRLDYIFLRKGHCLQAGPVAARDMARSDHEPILVQISARVKKLTKSERAGGVRHLPATGYKHPRLPRPDSHTSPSRPPPPDRHHLPSNHQTGAGGCRALL